MEHELDLLRAEDRDEARLETGLHYTSGEPVVLRVRKRGDRYDVDDEGAAVRLSGEPPGWLTAARSLMRAHGLAVDDAGVVSVPAVEGRDLGPLALSVADTSMALHAALVQRDLQVGFDSDTSVE